jgi:LPS export ABC transporter protein LptC
MSVNGKYQWFQFRRLLRGITNLTLFLILWLIWPRSLDSVSDMAQKTFSVPDYQMQSLRYVSVKNGHNEIELHAQHGAFLLEIQELRLRTIQANVFGEDQSVTKILSDRGSYRMRSRDLYLQDQIEVEASDGFKIFTDQAQYSLPTKIMKVPQALRGASADGGIKVAADRAEAPIFSKTIKLFGNATGSFVEKKHGFKISEQLPENLEKPDVVTNANKINEAMRLAQLPIITIERNSKKYTLESK